eukprot:m.11600 g.11600  ORF g.11600 m.11600 type:complete len:761 (+) comp4486_c0_seq1:106-2388(+)
MANILASRMARCVRFLRYTGHRGAVTNQYSVGFCTNTVVKLPHLTENQLQNLSELTFRSVEEVAKIKDREVILFSGPTGHGKSTAANWLYGIPMECIEENAMNYGFKATEGCDLIYEIGDDFIESHTAIPQCVSIPSDDNIVICDCPGQQDTRGEEYRLVSDISSYLMTQSAEHVRAVVVTIDIPSFSSGRAKVLHEVALRLHKVLQLSKGVNESIHFLITKSPIVNGQVHKMAKECVVKSLELAKASYQNKLDQNNFSTEEQKQEVQAAYAILSLMLEEDADGNKAPRVYIADVTDPNDAEEFLSRLLESPGLAASNFNPVICGNAAMLLRDSLSPYLAYGLPLSATASAIARFKAIGEDIEMIRQVGLKIQLAAQFKDIKEEKDSCEKKILKLQSKKKKLDSDELVDFWEESFVSSQYALFDVFVRDHEFKYEGAAFAEVQKVDNSRPGTLVSLINTIPDLLSERIIACLLGLDEDFTNQLFFRGRDLLVRDKLIIRNSSVETVRDVPASQALLSLLYGLRLKPINARDKLLIKATKTNLRLILGNQTFNDIFTLFGVTVGRFYDREINREEGMYREKYRVIALGGKANVTVTLKGEKRNREDIKKSMELYDKKIEKLHRTLDDLRKKEGEVQTRLANTQASSHQKLDILCKEHVRSILEERKKVAEEIVEYLHMVQNQGYNIEATHTLIQLPFIQEALHLDPIVIESFNTAVASFVKIPNEDFVEVVDYVGKKQVDSQDAILELKVPYKSFSIAQES